MPKRCIAELNERLDNQQEFEVHESFADDLPLQIRCHACGNHLLPQLVHGMMFYKHPTLWPRECGAPRDFRVTATYILHEVLTRVLATQGGSDGTVGDTLLKAVLFVTVEPTRESPLHIHLRESPVRAA